MLIGTKTITRQVLEKVITPSSLILIDGDVVKTYTHPDVEFGYDEAKDNVEAMWSHIENRSVFHMVAPDSTTHITMETDAYGDNRFEAIKKGEALVIKTLGHRILAKAFMQARSHKYPVRIFDCEADAIAWFDSLRKAEEKT